MIQHVTCISWKLYGSSCRCLCPFLTKGKKDFKYTQCVENKFALIDAFNQEAIEE